MTEAEPFGPMRCRATQHPFTTHECRCKFRVGHADSGEDVDAWHECPYCATRWTGERTLDIGGGAKVIQLHRFRTDEVYAPGAIVVPPDQLPAADRPSIPASFCPVCGDPHGVTLRAEFGQHVHERCKPVWMMTAEVARRHVNTIAAVAGVNVDLLDPDALESAYRYAARVITQIAQGAE